MMTAEKSERSEPFDTRVLARLAGGGALWVEMRTLADRDLSGITPSEAKRVIIEENVLAKATQSNRVKVANKLIGRYVLDCQSAIFNAFWHEYVRERNEAQRALLGYLLFCASDFLARQIGMEWLAPKLDSPGVVLTSDDLSAHLETLATEHDEIAAWSSTTRTRFVQHYLGAIRDFGLAEGKITKRVTRPHIGPGPMMLGVRYALMEKVSPGDALQSDWFRLFGLGLSSIIEKLYELNSLGIARFRVQGEVVELNLRGEDHDTYEW